MNVENVGFSTDTFNWRRVTHVLARPAKQGLLPLGRRRSPIEQVAQHGAAGYKQCIARKRRKRRPNTQEVKAEEEQADEGHELLLAAQRRQRTEVTPRSHPVLWKAKTTKHRVPAAGAQRAAGSPCRFHFNTNACTSASGAFLELPFPL